MNKPIYPFALVFVLLSALYGCAEDPNIEYGKYATQPTPVQPVIRQRPSQPKPVQSKPYRSDSSSYTDTYSSHYGDSGYSGNYAESPEVQSFIEQMVQKHGFTRSYLSNLFAHAQRLNSVIRLENGTDHAPGPPKPRLGSWTRYRNKFLTEEHISSGVDFWHKNANAIQKASTTYGVDPEYIVGIIGVETYFGRNIGKTCVFDSLTTLAFDTERRSKYFKSELENFLLMTREEGYEPRELVGSWAGAMGLGQFMPSSFRRLAIDFNQDGKRDLWHPQDAIGSVAHYFSRNGWQYQEPVTMPANTSGGSNVIDLSTYEGDEYWETFHNFKVIKRYNNSKKYAMAVHQLAKAIKARL